MQFIIDKYQSIHTQSSSRDLFAGTKSSQCFCEVLQRDKMIEGLDPVVKPRDDGGVGGDVSLLFSYD